MSDKLVNNLRFMLLIIGKDGCRHPDCPVSSTLYGTMISWLFNDVARHPEIVNQYVKNRQKLDESLASEGLSYETVVANKDRILFKHINLFPDSIMNKYGDYITWFSNFLIERASDRVIELIYMYIDAMDKNMKHM